MNKLVLAVIACLMVFACGNALAQEKQAVAKKIKAAKKTAAQAGQVAKPAKAKPGATTHKVKKAPFRISVQLSGYLESARMQTVALKPESWSSFKVVKAVAQGAMVKKGEVLVRFDLKKINEAIEDAQKAAVLSKLAIRLAELDLEYQLAIAPMDLAAADRGNKQAAENLKNYLEIDEPFQRKSAAFSIKSAENYLAYNKEELKQLERMYFADDLTEETEEIILKRQRDSVERSEFSLERTRIANERSLQVTIARTTNATKEAAVRKKKLWDWTRATASMKLDQKRLNLEKMKQDHEKAAKKLQKLHKDREAMIVKAPMGGIVYYGKPDHGKWSSTPSIGPRLKPEGSLKAGEVFMTIVQAGALQMTVSVPEAQIRFVKVGAKGRATTTAYPESSLNVKVLSVSSIPVAPGKFEAKLSLAPYKNDENAKRIVPGLACSIRLTPYFNKEAITVPSGAVSREGQSRVVYLKGAKGKPEKREVKVGKSFDGKTEIVEGLEEGDEILLKRP